MCVCVCDLGQPTRGTAFLSRAHRTKSERTRFELFTKTRTMRNVNSSFANNGLHELPSYQVRLETWNRSSPEKMGVRKFHRIL